VKRQRSTVAPSHAASTSSHCSRNPELEQLVCLVQHQVRERDASVSAPLRSSDTSPSRSVHTITSYRRHMPLDAPPPFAPPTPPPPPPPPPRSA